MVKLIINYNTLNYLRLSIKFTIESTRNLNLSTSLKSKLSRRFFFADINHSLSLEIASDFKLVCKIYLLPSVGTF